MRSRHALAIAIGAFFSIHSSYAAPSQKIQGQVLDPQGTPIKNAKVHMHGRQQFVFTNAQGQFSLNADQNSTLHIAADGYSEQFIKASTMPMQVTLQHGKIEHLMVQATGLHHYDLDLAHPATILTSDELNRRAEPTIGETLKMTPGVHSTYYGPVAAAPVIRGLDGPRVKMLSNGLDSADASRLGPDHAISADAITTEQIEVLRGPATLLYGSGAIGGVVNLVDNRIPRQQRAPQTIIDGKAGTVANEKTVALSHDGSLEQWAWHVDAMDRATDNFATPAFIDEDGETLREINNSWLDKQSMDAGLSYLGERGMIGFAASHQQSNYGIPGHHEAHDAQTPIADHEGVYAALSQSRYAMATDWYNPSDAVESISLQAAYTDYQHTEIEDDVPGTRFENNSLETRLSAEHNVGIWHGLLGLHSQWLSFAAIGDEAFTPATDSQSHAIFLLEETRIGNLNYQLGARFEHNVHQAKQVELADLRRNASSLSAGAVWKYHDDYQLSSQLSYSQRAPAASEAYANGLHIATKGYELGLGYQQNQSGEWQWSAENIALEQAMNFDFGWQKTRGDWTFAVTAYRNNINNFIYLHKTDLHAEDFLGEHTDHSADHTTAPHDSFPVYQYQQADSHLSGAELSVRWQVSDWQSLELFADKTRAKLVDGGNLPRIPPLKVGLNYQYQDDQWTVDLGLTRYNAQQDIADDESQTPGYQLVDFAVRYDFELESMELSGYLKGTNLTNELALVHTSFIKNEVPLPGRAFTLGLTARF